MYTLGLGPWENIHVSISGRSVKTPYTLEAHGLTLTYEPSFFCSVYVHDKGSDRGWEGDDLYPWADDHDDFHSQRGYVTPLV